MFKVARTLPMARYDMLWWIRKFVDLDAEKLATVWATGRDHIIQLRWQRMCILQSYAMWVIPQWASGAARPHC